ncbi:FG-GAP repeat protein [Anatilimnocola aggregata]|uniref:FG-GAP repeat protein n=1 Tax=Anatilimnocola aggregata TaxID=2528021 RepID=A0A517YMK0_9BACT|nr:VCBS repeat-containing protein [Anatilimnocola aggregata]QDU31436.1 FG-GAP repeat protein [Anatilimnocola aggregata]
MKTCHVFAVLVTCVLGSLQAAEIPFKAEELPTKLGVGYAVRLIDMNNDQKLDICIVDQTRILWLENPTWKEHTLIDKQTRPDNVCFAPADIDGDGKIDFAVGADWKPFNTESGGTVQWIRRNPNEHKKDVKAPLLWEVHPISEVPTVHRINFADLDGDKKPELIVSPLMGRGTTKPNWQEATCQLLSYKIPADPVKGPWEPTVIDDKLHVTHNFQVTDFDHDGQPDILYVGFEGVSLLTKDASGKWQNKRIGEGNQKTSPNRGASEIKHGMLGKSGDYIATIEPWHGHQVVVYTKPTTERPSAGEGLWNRQVVDEELKWGHAVWCANLDDDEAEELVIGIRDDLGPTRKGGVRIYDPQDAAGQKWERQFVDQGGVAVEDLAVGDLNGDGKAEIVAVGRATHNVKIYWNGK